jgi:hypothetical protein
VCASEKLLERRFAGAGAAVRFVLTVLQQSDTLGDIRTLQSLQLYLIPPTQTHRGRLLIRHKEIDVTTELLTDNTTVVYTDNDSSEWLNPIRRLRIISIVRNG